MDRLRPEYLTREQLSRFLGANPDLIRAFETFIDALSTAIPDELAELQLSAATSAALVDTLAGNAEADRRNNEPARLLVLSGQVDQLREQLAAIPDDTALQVLSGQVAQLAAQVAAGGQMRRLRVVADKIALGAGTASATYTISPALSSLDLADLRYLGATATAGVGVTDAQVSIELTNLSTVTARRIGTTGTATAYFQITEYTQ